MRTFFSGSELSVLKKPVGRVPECGACGLFKNCNTPKMEPSGRGKKRILIVSESPGPDEDARGLQLAGNTGQELIRIMGKYGIDVKRDCWIDNSLRCRPTNSESKDKKKWVDYCRPNIINSIEEFQPEIIVLLGATACQSVLGWLWKDDVGGISRWAGYQIPHQRLNCWICPTYHPAHLNKEKSRVLNRRFEEQIEAISQLDSRPWEKTPNYEKDIQIIYSPSEVPAFLNRYKEGVVSFDYETNTLKPDSKEAQIVSCSVCFDGKETVAYPWHGEAVEATRALFKRPGVRFVGANIKFEDRWTRAKLGIEIGKAWLHDVVLGAHAIYNASKVRKITSVKYQSFVFYGVDSYDDHIKPFLRTKKGGNSINKIKEIDMKSLLLYNGMDSLLEYKIAMNQMKTLKRGCI